MCMVELFHIFQDGSHLVSRVVTHSGLGDLESRVVLLEGVHGGCKLIPVAGTSTANSKDSSRWPLVHGLRLREIAPAKGKSGSH